MGWPGEETGGWTSFNCEGTLPHMNTHSQTPLQRRSSRISWARQSVLCHSATLAIPSGACPVGPCLKQPRLQGWRLRMGPASRTLPQNIWPGFIIIEDLTCLQQRPTLSPYYGVIFQGNTSHLVKSQWHWISSPGEGAAACRPWGGLLFWIWLCFPASDASASTTIADLQDAL